MVYAITRIQCAPSRHPAFRTPRVQCGDVLFYKAITDCKFHRAAEKQFSLLWSNKDANNFG